MEDTIAAVSTLVGNSAINIIKVSGSNSIEIVNKYFKGKNLNTVESNTINYGKFIYNNEIIDEVLISVFRSPKSYTTENVVEINSHGGILCTNKILEILLEDNIRLAEPGEFIKRAFLNGRIDLVEAEAVGDLINSTSESARKLSINGLNGKISKLITNLRDDILSIMGNIEVNIDYPEYDDIEKMTIDTLKIKVKELEEKFKNILDKSKQTNLIKNGINIGIIGKPNVGKSSILNMFLGEEKAIVSDIQGTTRDIVEGKINLNGITLNFIDTAGIRNTEDKIEKIGVKKSLDIIEKSDLILFVMNNNEIITKEEFQLLNDIKDKNLIIVINKSDLQSKINIKELEDYNIVKINTINENDFKKLENKIIDLYNLGKIENSDFTYLSNIRQINLLKESMKILENIKDAIKQNIPIDLIEIDLKRLWDKLGEILGTTYSDELLDEIFSKFCLGK